VLEPLLLALAGGDDALPDLGGGLAGGFAGDFAELDGGDLDVQVDAAQVTLDVARGAAGLAGHFAVGRARRCLFVIAMCASSGPNICPPTTVEFQFPKTRPPSAATCAGAGSN
jgi:hypothetical protein